MSEAGLVLIHQAYVFGLIRVNGINLHVGGLGEGGRFVAHKTPGEGADFIQGQLLVVREDVYVIPHFRIPVIYAKYGSWGGIY